LDKDAFLEALFAEAPPTSAGARNVLSRHADSQFRSAAEAARDAILVSWWRHPQSGEASGTPTAWLANGVRDAVEIFCECPASTALKRFLDRTRHPGHLDVARDRQALAAQFVAAEKLGPLGLFPVIRVDTTSRIDIAALAKQVRDLLPTSE
jgi:glucokinase